jgi:hypothetical protein
MENNGTYLKTASCVQRHSKRLMLTLLIASQIVISGITTIASPALVAGNPDISFRANSSDPKEKTTIRIVIAGLFAAVLIAVAPSPGRHIQKQTERAARVNMTTAQAKPVAPLETKPMEGEQSQPEILAKAEEVKAPEPATPQPTPIPPVETDHQALLQAAGVPSSDWPAVEFIFKKESSWRPTATNNKGCIGLGQNCPDKKGYYWLHDACPNWQADTICQIQRFSNYATARYGGWWQAHAFWLANGWW